MENILTKTSLPKWIAKLSAYRIYAPVLKEDLWSFEPIDNPEQITADYTNAVQSCKKIVFPQKEIFLEFSNKNEGQPEIKEVLPSEEKEVVVFGIRPCDAKGISHLDKVFGGDFKDLYYWRRRDKIILIGIACNTPPTPNCFCTSVDGSPHGKDGLDMLLTDLGDRYYAQTFTQKGENLIDAAKSLFAAAQPKDKTDLDKIHREAEAKIPRQLKDAKIIPPKLKGLFDSELWDQEAKSCIQCGICTYLCPTCHCFDINDEILTFSPIGGKRVRTWDNCQFPDFTMHSSGHNPRPHKSSRLRQRIFHKFQYFVENYKDYQCIGCGRCISKCPVGIDIIEVLEKVRDHE